ncbi:MAG: hypothetical protein A2503_18705 [Burkholderiales bacterium RIFOXYD12_FULL_59_19]|nr:MAG: hypothetical protein A2503_18705 [Burkholderiales bacterium RIFOXYD12_FULL_59_19]
MNSDDRSSEFIAIIVSNRAVALDGCYRCVLDPRKYRVADRNGPMWSLAQPSKFLPALGLERFTVQLGNALWQQKAPSVARTDGALRA